MGRTTENQKKVPPSRECTCNPIIRVRKMILMMALAPKAEGVASDELRGLFSKLRNKY